MTIEIFVYGYLGVMCLAASFLFITAAIDIRKEWKNK
jgi:hypothetical protein